jgi:hypothetical protein
LFSQDLQKDRTNRIYREIEEKGFIKGIIICNYRSEGPRQGVCKLQKLAQSWLKGLRGKNFGCWCHSQPKADDPNCAGVQRVACLAFWCLKLGKESISRSWEVYSPLLDFCLCPNLLAGAPLHNEGGFPPTLLRVTCQPPLNTSQTHSNRGP